ncbi:nodulin homeobox-like isoform X2 [Miscanthus floridulus]|uniref:nodulin homeobox-like isoform X2 n=1 Tax=Miscanthus floridulus TaxID=154761 RepID=UPI00345B209A
MIDMVSAIEELSGLTSKELGEMLKESDNFVLQSKTEDGGPKQVDMEKLVSSLPLHLLAVCLELGQGPDLTYVLRGMRFLHSLSDLASRHTRLEQVLLDDVKLSEQVMDLIFFLLSILAEQKKENNVGASPLVHASLVAASLHLLTSYFSSQWHELVHILLAHPKVDIFMDVAFDSLHEVVRLLNIRLSSMGSGSFHVGSLESRRAHFICQQGEASLQFLLLLCQQKLFRDRILKNKELSRNGGILSLSHTILKLDVPECLKQSTDLVASISRLKAKILSILLQLCEAESVSYLDEVATNPNSRRLGQTLALKVLNLLKIAFGRKQNITSDSHDKGKIYPMGSVLISALRLVDVFSDDSNFRSSFMTNTVPFLTQILATPHEEFVSSWCSVNVPAIEEDASLDYDPFGASEVALLASDNVLTEAKANYSCPFRPSLPSMAYAQTRTSCVVKIIANLHIFVPNICEEQERDLFLLNFQKYLVSGSPKLSADEPASSDFKATKVCRNLGSLSDYAKTLVPNLLNVEDVVLLSDFSDKLQSWCKSQVEQVAVKVGQNDTPPESTEDIHPVQQPLLTRTSTPDSKMNNLPKDVQNMEVSTPIPPINPEGNDKDGTPKNTVSRNGGFLQNAVGQNLVHLGVARTVSGGSSVVTSGVSTGLQRSKMDLDPASSSVDNFKTPELTKENGLQEDEKGESSMYDERQPKRRKRTLMNNEQIDELEKALVDEPEMHKNAVLLQSWSEKLSLQGPEITASQLKNWLNNRKAKLARIAKERGPFEGENADKPSTPATIHLGESSESAGEDNYLPPARVMNALSKGRLVSPDSNEQTSQAELSPNTMLIRPFTRSFSLEPGRLVSLVDSDGKEVGRGKVFQTPGKSPAESRVCMVDVTELRTEKWRELPHPSQASGRTFQEAEARNGGIMRVSWDVVRLSPAV